MNKEALLYGVIGLLGGVIIAGSAAGYAVNNNIKGMMRMMGVEKEMVRPERVQNHMGMSMSEMSKELKNKMGDDFDKAFIEMMVAHHEGAVDMAKLIPLRAKHEELRKLGENIISAQTKEIGDMKEWQKNWGYASSEMMQRMHGR